MRSELRVDWGRRQKFEGSYQPMNHAVWVGGRSQIEVNGVNR